MDGFSEYERERYREVIEAKRPDMMMELFWLVFKDFFRSKVSTDMVERIDELSKKLNQLQSQEQYDLIYYNINCYLVDATVHILTTNNSHTVSLLLTHFRRWIRIQKSIGVSEEEVDKWLNQLGIFYRLLLVYDRASGKIHQRKEKTDGMDKVCQLVVLYAKDPKHEILDYIMAFGILDRIDSVVENLREYVDITRWLKEDVPDRIKDNLQRTGVKKLHQWFNLEEVRSFVQPKLV